MRVIIGLMLIMAVSCLSTFHFHEGDQLLSALQERNNNVYVIMIAKDDSQDKKLQLTNARVADGLYHNVLTVPVDPNAPPAPAGQPPAEPAKRDVVWARVNADDIDRNGHFLERLKVDLASLEEWPTVMVIKNGVGSSMHGPTTVRHAMRHVEELTAKPK